MNTPSHRLLGQALVAALAAAPACRDVDAQHPAPPFETPQADPDVQPIIAPSGDPVSTNSVAASPLVSRGKRVTGSSPLRFARVTNVNDGDPRTVWDAGKPTPDRPSWAAIDVGKGPAKVLLTWSAAGSFDYEETQYGSPGAYRIETSADSTDGANGAWREVARAENVTTNAAAHGFDFAGRRWARIVVTGAPDPSPNGVQIGEIAVHDMTRGAADVWFFMGDSITAFAFGRLPPGEPGFAARVHARHPQHFPAVINGGIGGHKSDDGLRRVDAWLARSPDIHFWGIAYGTNDAAGDADDPSRFAANLRAIVERVRAAGRVPILATIPYAADGHRHVPRFNAAIDEIRRANALPAGPDLHAWFSAHPEELSDGLHPNDRGIASINRLWAEAVDSLYAPRRTTTPHTRGGPGE